MSLIGPANPLRAMVVDDSAVVRGLITRMLESDPAIKVVASVSNGKLAVDNVERNNVEVVILDIEMPVMDGLTALPLLLKVDPKLQIIMASTLTLNNAEISLKALQAGAADYIPKPTTSREISGGMDFKHELLGKAKSLGEARRRSIGDKGAAAQTATAARPVAGARPAGGVRVGPAQFNLHATGPKNAKVLAIGSSTGGPQALFTVLKGLKAGNLGIPIIITQHMPAKFTTILAEHITRMSGWPASEAKDGDIIRPGHVLVAPGDFHMLIESKGTDKVVRLTQDPPENFCRPAVDPMFRSVSAAYGGHVLAVVLTGMGADGAKGGVDIVENGGTLIAQDEATSVVWGMPGAAAEKGICSAVLPVNDIAPSVIRFVSQGKI
ncbi:MAG: chemotaxis response regulator protein-glutamate methylesterase [Rhodospirillales bacterium]|nr:chemotaxis response regulator protein-glutamate methylesterase [Rhodospirillales bacterium]MCW8860959.1 chemotaxis response regulator protein-glutamate methylesterase [Rhodospirillales bacterium]MCW8951274.1 chemotaxis response regulator protein-glutamate methylesterase [Rhodospirillales bacterium]MCW8970746.1 chemotaxis response regulator protein-glutamate methylesterase [Rhodospirillales bacterium]MCW9001339.1 chemotaxis response regulator protein-glutamate methylesterase [Rhodospirillales